jgi:hypothetical protein
MLLRLIDECPVLSADLDTKTSGRALRVSTDFSFISENRQIARVRQFIEELPDRLVG